MKFSIDSINFVHAGSSQPIIGIKTIDEDDKYKNFVLLCNVEENDDVMENTLPYNLTSMKRNGSSTLIHNLYDIDDVCIKSTIKKSNANDINSENPSDDFVDIYAPSTHEDISYVCKNGTFTYCLTKRKSETPAYKVTNLDIKREQDQWQSVTDTNYNWRIREQELNTYIYAPLSDDLDLSSHFDPKFNLTNIKYNYVFELPQSSATFNNYEYGDVYGDIFNCKNVYNWQYSMDMSSQTYLNATRDYVGMGVCGNKLFMSFYDDLTYSSNDTSDEFNKSMTEGKLNEPLFSYQKLETIDSINRFRNNTIHKSNVYSIDIVNTGLEVLNDEENPVFKKLYDKILLDINNNVRSLAEKVAPANTELFDVKVK